MHSRQLNPPPLLLQRRSLKQRSEKSAPVEKSSTEPADYGRMTMEERWKEREQRYEDLKKRAEEAGVMLPETPPWQDRKARCRPIRRCRCRNAWSIERKCMSMTPQERDAYRLERYQEMRQRAEEIGVDLPETPPWMDRQARMDDEWAKQQEVIQGMTDEERAACHAMHRRHMREMMGPGPGPGPGPMKPMMRGQGMYPPPAYEAPAPGYGYGPYPYGPRGNYWEPNQ